MIGSPQRLLYRRTTVWGHAVPTFVRRPGPNRFTILGFFSNGQSLNHDTAPRSNQRPGAAPWIYRRAAQFNTKGVARRRVPNLCDWGGNSWTARRRCHQVQSGAGPIAATAPSSDDGVSHGSARQEHNGSLVHGSASKYAPLDRAGSRRSDRSGFPDLS